MATYSFRSSLCIARLTPSARLVPVSRSAIICRSHRTSSQVPAPTWKTIALRPNWPVHRHVSVAACRRQPCSGPIGAAVRWKGSGSQAAGGIQQPDTGLDEVSLRAARWGEVHHLRATSADQDREKKTRAPEHNFSRRSATDGSEGRTADAYYGLENLQNMVQTVQFSYKALSALVLAVVGGTIALVINWRMVSSNVSRESAQIISRTIEDEQLQHNASEFSKALLNQILNDKEVEKTVAKWVMHLLTSLQNEIGGLFVIILQQEAIVQAVNRLADRLVEHLCSSETIQAQVGQLLVNAICLDSSRNATAQWAYELVMREDVIFGFRDLVVAALQTENVQQEASNLARQVVNTVISDPATIGEAKQTLNDALRDSDLRAAAKESLWSVVLPWSSAPKKEVPEKNGQKLLLELMRNEAVTEEERQMLQALQARLQTGGAPLAQAVAPQSSEPRAPQASAGGPTPAAPAEEDALQGRSPDDATTAATGAACAPDALTNEASAELPASSCSPSIAHLEADEKVVATSTESEMAPTMTKAGVVAAEAGNVAEEGASKREAEEVLVAKKTVEENAAQKHSDEESAATAKPPEADEKVVTASTETEMAPTMTKAGVVAAEAGSAAEEGASKREAEEVVVAKKTVEETAAQKSGDEESAAIAKPPEASFQAEPIVVPPTVSTKTLERGEEVIILSKAIHRNSAGRLPSPPL